MKERKKTQRKKNKNRALFEDEDTKRILFLEHLFGIDRRLITYLYFEDKEKDNIICEKLICISYILCLGKPTSMEKMVDENSMLDDLQKIYNEIKYKFSNKIKKKQQVIDDFSKFVFPDLIRRGSTNLNAVNVFKRIMNEKEKLSENEKKELLEKQNEIRRENKELDEIEHKVKKKKKKRKGLMDTIKYVSPEEKKLQRYRDMISKKKKKQNEKKIKVRIKRGADVLLQFSGNQRHKEKKKRSKKKTLGFTNTHFINYLIFVCSKRVSSSIVKFTFKQKPSYFDCIIELLVLFPHCLDNIKIKKKKPKKSTTNPKLIVESENTKKGTKATEELYLKILNDYFKSLKICYQYFVDGKYQFVKEYEKKKNDLWRKLKDLEIIFLVSNDRTSNSNAPLVYNEKELSLDGLKFPLEIHTSQRTLKIVEEIKKKNGFKF